MRSGLLDRLAPGLFRIAGAPMTWRAAELGAIWASGSSAVASHRAAAHLLGLEGFTHPPARPELTVVRPASGARRLALVHQTLLLARTDRTEVDGIPTTRVERTLLDLAAVLDRPALESVLDAALRDGRTTARRLIRRTQSDGSRRTAGRARLGDLLGIGPRPESWLERQALRIIRAAGLPEPEVQRVIRDRDGRIRRIDLSWCAGLLLVEVSGHASHSTRRQRQRDRERANRSVLEGRIVLEFTYEDLTERPDHPIALIEQALVQLDRLTAGTDGWTLTGPERSARPPAA